MSPGDLWIICQNLSVLKYQAAARFGGKVRLTALATFQNIINRLAKKLIIEHLLASFLRVDCSLALSFN
jgi:hypothetical protein